MDRTRGGLIGAEPTWSSTYSSGLWSLRHVNQQRSDGKWLPSGRLLAPQNVNGTASEDAVALTWTAPAIIQEPLTGYVVEYTPAGGDSAVVYTGSTATEYTLAGLTPGVAYSIRVAGFTYRIGAFSTAITRTPAEDVFLSLTSLGLAFDGSSGSQTLVDTSPNLFLFSGFGSNSAVDTSVAKFGTGSLGPDAPTGLPGRFAIGTQPFTFEAWVRITSEFSGDWKALFDFGVVNDGFIVDYGVLYLTRRDNIITNQGTDSRVCLFLSVYRDGASVVYYFGGAGDITVNTWHHIAVSRSSVGVTLFVNGEDVTIVQDGFGNQVLGPVLPDAYPPGSGLNLVGSPGLNIDDLRLTVGDVRYASPGFTPPAYPNVGTPLPTAPAAGSDPMWADVLALLPFDTNLADAGPLSLAPSSTKFLLRAAKFGRGLEVIRGNVSGTSYSTPSIAGGDDFTLECWVAAFAPVSGNTDSEASLSLGAGKVRIRVTRPSLVTDALYLGVDTTDASNMVTQRGQVSMTLGQFYHVAVVRDSGTMHIHINGSQYASFADSQTIPGGLGFGAVYSSPATFDDVRLTAGVRYPGGTPFTPPTSPHPTGP